MAQSEEKQEKSLLETAAGTLESELLEDAEVESKTEESVEEAAVFKVWGEDEHQDADKDDVEDTSDEEEEETPVDEEEDDGIEGSKEPDEGPSDSEVKEDEEEAEDEEETEEGYMDSDADEEDDEVDTDDVEVSADDAEADMEDEVEDEAEGEDGEEGDFDADDVLSGDEEEMEEDEEDGIEGSAEPNDDVASAVDQITQTVIKAATMKAQKKIQAEYDSMKEDVDALCADDESLSEDFKAKAATIFEAAVTSKVNTHIDQLSESFTEYVADEIQSVHEGLIEKIDGYLTYVAEEWINKNEVGVTNILRTEIAESFMSSIKESFTDHYIEMPEGKTDMFDEITQKNADLSESIQEKELENQKLAEALVQLQKDAVVNELSEGLVATDAAKFKKLTADIVFESKEEFSKKVSIIRESYFSKKVVEETEVKEEIEESGNTTTHTVVEELDQSDDGLSPIMAKYIKASTKLESEAFGK
jgi:hypothetical protein